MKNARNLDHQYLLMYLKVMKVKQKIVMVDPPQKQNPKRIKNQRKNIKRKQNLVIHQFVFRIFYFFNLLFLILE
jgi:hypothetical protein